MIEQSWHYSVKNSQFPYYGEERNALQYFINFYSRTFVLFCVILNLFILCNLPISIYYQVFCCIYLLPSFLLYIFHVIIMTNYFVKSPYPFKQDERLQILCHKLALYFFVDWNQN